MATKFARFVVLSFGAIVLLAACSSPVATTTSSPAPSHVTSSPSPVATSPSTATSPIAGETKGFGDTATNPDNSYICAASASAGGSVYAYLTVAGSDTASGKSLCSTLEQGGNWVAVTTIAASAYVALDATNGCFDTVGKITSRIYTATGGDAASTLTLCQGFGL